jgi:hypothetical protein
MTKQLSGQYHDTEGRSLENKWKEQVNFSSERTDKSQSPGSKADKVDAVEK